MTPSRTERAAAFSLIEMLVAISIALLIVGVAVLSIGAVNEEARIERAGALLEAVARAALEGSVREQRDHWIEFSAKGFAGGVERQTQFRMPGDGSIEVRHWGEEAWREAEDGSGRGSWHFSREGLCEPIQVRMTLGRARLEMQFDPLTGAVAEKSLVVKKG